MASRPAPVRRAVLPTLTPLPCSRMAAAQAGPQSGSQSGPRPVAAGAAVLLPALRSPVPVFHVGAQPPAPRVRPGAAVPLHHLPVPRPPQAPPRQPHAEHPQRAARRLDVKRRTRPTRPANLEREYTHVEKNVLSSVTVNPRFNSWRTRLVFSFFHSLSCAVWPRQE